MPKVLTEEQVAQFDRDGYLSPVRAMSPERAGYFRGRLESLEERYPNDIKKMKTKSHILCPWVLDIAEDPHVLDIFEDLIGPDILCWSMAWRTKKADAKTFAGWHQDSSYSSPQPIIVLGALALSECGPAQGCLRGIPGSHKWGRMKHEETNDPTSILARGQYISDQFDETKAVDFALKPGEMVMFHYSLVHGSAPNFGPDRRILLLVEMMPAHATQAPFRESALLVRGTDNYNNFDADPRPDAEFSEAAVANWQKVVQARAARLFHNSKYGPSEAYGGTRPAA